MRSVETNTQVQLRDILFATDFSPNSQVALDYAIAVARRYESRLFVAHVITPDSAGLAPPQDSRKVSQWVRQDAEEKMAGILISGVLRDVPHQVLLAQGAVWPVLSDMIENKEIDLVVVGTHGRTGVGKLFLGSAAEEIFRFAKCPVMTVGPRASGKAPREVDFRRILFATDFSPHSLHAAAYAFALAQEFQARLTLVHVVRDAIDPATESIFETREIHEGRLKMIIPPEAELWCKPEFVVGFGDPAETILDQIEARRADLVVLGVRSGDMLTGHGPAGIAYKVVCKAPCPVLTIREESSA
jgi:nucleotide-binding universal stress UspA family protein